MSGGVDSSVAAALVREQGYDVIGIAMRLAPDGLPRPGKGGSCCSADDFEDARRVAELMEFPFYVIDLRQEFKRTVIDYFVTEYASGRTPNPCAMCNREVKFERLWERALALQADYVATGHYARVTRDADGRWRLWRARDVWKDQSYFLFNLAGEVLARTLFPVGDLTKQEVRQHARRLELRNADKTESQEICFVQSSDYADFVAARVSPEVLGAGSIVDASGHELGRHDGIHRYTVGQRRGLGIAAAEALFVREINAENREVVAVPKDQLLSKGLFASQVRMVNPLLEGQTDLAVQVKIRSRHPGIAATLSTFAAGSGGLRAEVKFLEQFPAVTPGQACVFYDGNEVLGGGFIDAPMAVP
jgi:tRNA-specific 2-thiouridylase